ncbi:PilN domain-containing protein [Acaryochloris sp. IP29b_bin.148]|uniref:PilN domain-containing protein n=1 Tax=Acaryochloris sp. IP29b_bin.148 TaxID=2969218 RepID=UPI00261869EC|nr:PilN domain-containing protein [Acaryochloris sp. IP29b_bin.148]
MYSIDINLLNDRPEYSQQIVAASGYDSDDKTPMFIGLGVGAAALGLVLVSFGVMTFMNQRLTAEEEKLDDELAQLAPDLSRVDSLKAQEQQVKAETKALATIFNQIKPWSATLQDIRDRVPPTLQITKIQQKAATPPSQPQQAGKPNTQAVAALSAPTQLSITGNAISFNDVNDFVLTLRKSPFLTVAQTQLMSSERKTNDRTQVSLVEHQLETTINDVPASELLQVLNAKGASGLAARIGVLKQKGVMNP